MACPPSVLLESRLPNKSSKYSEEGTAAHALAAAVLTLAGASAASWIGWHYNIELKTLVRDEPVGPSILIDGDMATPVQNYVDAIHVYAEGHSMRVECKLNLTPVLGIAEQFGTADVVILTADETELQVHDLKFGMGVRVDAEWNEQLMLYALGAYNEVALTAEVETVRCVIHMPRLGFVSEWSLSVVELLKWADNARKSAVKADDIATTGIYDESELNAGDDQCRFCRAKALCSAAINRVQEAVNLDPDFNNLDAVPGPGSTDSDTLALAMKAVDFIEGWLKAVRAEVERRLFVGETVEGFKLVRGRKGARGWGDNAAEVEKQLKIMRLKQDEMYSFTLLTPPALEKRLGPWLDGDGATRDPVLGPRQWPKIKEFITQSEGNVSVAPVSDKRETYVPADVAFAPVNDLND